MRDKQVNRYDFMRPGVVKDEQSGNNFPDPLSLNYLDIKISDRPVSVTLTEQDTMHFWNVANNVYGASHLDDIVLTLNGVPHYNLLETKDTLYFPSETDIARSFKKERRK